MKKNNRIIPQMFDVRPVNETGDLDLEKIGKVGSISIARPKKVNVKKDYLKNKLSSANQENFNDIKKYPKETRELEMTLRKNFLEQKRQEEKVRLNRIKLQRELEEARKGNNKIMQLGVFLNSNEVPIVYKIEHLPKKAEETSAEIFPEKDEFILENDDWNNEYQYQNPEPEQKLKLELGSEQESEPKLEPETIDREFLRENEFISKRNEWAEEYQRQEKEYFIEKNKFSWAEFFSKLRDRFLKFEVPTWPEFPEAAIGLKPRKSLFSFALASSFIFLIIFGVGFLKKSLEVKKTVLGTSQVAYANLMQAKEGMLRSNFQDSSFRFGEAYDNFNNISEELSSLGGILVDGSRFFPYISKLSSGKYLAEAGKNISRIGILSGEIMRVLEQIKNPLENTGNNDSVSFLKIFQDSSKNSEEILSLLKKTNKDLDKVNVDDIPEEQRVQFVELKNKLPQMETFVKGFVDNSQIFSDILGGNGPRKYLFLFQNNQEMRATGGFVGSYGVLDIFNGRINKFFIDGIFNPDGQLREKVIPPTPIQKISAAWSLHDSNWFPDFPVSAEKAIWFYEKTGGPTVDGIITMTPDVMKKLLEVSGPIDMPEYDVIIDKDNFLEKVQNEVEVAYDKELNQPKKILADLAPKILDAIFNSKKVSSVVKTLDILMESLNEKQILLYSRNYEIEKKISEEGWSGEVLSTDKDYLSIINSNINGFKTDGVIEETIEHNAEIKEDGSILDSIIITRKHNGGDTQYDWFNKVNADYMRVYVPKGSKLISVEGQTREFNSPPLDYKALNFKRDPQVAAEEESIKIDEESGTRIYEDAGKTVFANWVYVSPKEEVMIRYTYLLPFKLSVGDSSKPVDAYSLLAQKQSGSLGSSFVSNITYPRNYDLVWRYPESLIDNSNENGENKLKIETNLKKDKFIGAVFSNNK